MLSHPLEAFMANVPNYPKEGILFRDISPLVKDHFVECVDALSELFTQEEWDKVDYLVGVESRGFIFASGLAYKHKKGVIKARKAGKLPNVHSSISYGLEYGEAVLEMQKGDGKNVLIIDDLIATGGSMQAACDLSKEVGYQVVGLACLVDLAALNSFSYQDMKVRSVIQYNDA